MRLFSRLTLHDDAGKRVESVTVRITAAVPAGSRVLLTDVQLQPGRYITGWTLHPSDLGVQPVEGWSWRNAVLAGSQHVVVAADVDSASPTRWDVRRASTGVQIGQYYLGATGSAERVDGWGHTATCGAGIPPHLTERADVTVATKVTGRVMACCWFRGIATPGDDLIEPTYDTTDDGTVTGSHSTWGQAVAVHDDWTSVLTTHADWS